jgi:hypothetical protein
MLKRIVSLGLACVIAGGAISAMAQSSQMSPTETVRAFYRMMREKKFKEAFGLSIYRPAIDGLDAKEFDDLRPDFEKMASVIPPELELSGETISGDMATVFVKVKETAETAEKSEPVMLIRTNGVWLVGDPESDAIVKKAGKKFFFNARIETHHNEVQSMLTRITLAEIAYSAQNNGKYANLAELIKLALIPKDLEGSDTTGYRFAVITSADGKSWYATAEPAQYGRTGKLSFYLDAAGVKSGDVGGKPLVPKN